MGKRPTKAATRRRSRTPRKRARAAAGRKRAAASSAKGPAKPRPAKRAKSTSRRKTWRATKTKTAAAKTRRKRRAPATKPRRRATAPARKSAARKSKRKVAAPETQRASAPAVAARAAPRVPSRARRASRTQPAGRRKAPHRRTLGRRSGLSEARPSPGVRRASPTVSGVTIRVPLGPRYAEVLTPDALAFLADLHRRFDAQRREVLAKPAGDAEQAEAGERSGLRTEAVERGVASVAPLGRESVVEASDASAYIVVNFENAGLSAWTNNLDRQVDLKERWGRALDLADAGTGSGDQRETSWPVPIVRPRGWHTLEERFAVDDRPVAGALFDFGLYAFHNARPALARVSALYAELPGLESDREAQLWNEVFSFTEERLGLPAGCIKVTVPQA